MAKRVVLTTVGSSGDVHPFIAVGKALQNQGFEVVIAAIEALRDKVEKEGLAFHAVRPTAEQVLADTGMDEAAFLQEIAQTNTALIIKKSILPYIEQSFEDYSAVMRHAHLVVTSSFSLIARLAVEKLGLPSVSLLLSPIAFFSSEEEIHLMEVPWLTRVRRIFGPKAVKLVLNLGWLQSKWQTRRISHYRRQLGLPPVKGDEILDGPLRANWIAALYTPLMGPLPIDVPQNSFIAGFTFYDSEFGGPSLLSKSLSDFLENGDAPLVFTLGSLAVYAAGDFYETAVEIAKRMGKRAVLLVGPQAEAQLKRLASEDIFVAGYAPHSMVFPYAAAIIHHGGIGTVAQALRAGRPQLVRC